MNAPGRTRADRPSSRRPAPPRPWWQLPSAWVLSLVVVGGVIAIAVAARGTEASDDRTESAPVEVIGDALAPYAVPDAAIGAQLPTISAESLDGEAVTIGADGIGRVIGLFAHWCPHCQAELPQVTDWLEGETVPDGVEVVAISTGVDPSGANYPPSEWFDRVGWPADVLMDSSTSAIASSLGLPGYPFWVVVDRDGTVVARASGALTRPGFATLLQLAAAGS